MAAAIPHPHMDECDPPTLQFLDARARLTEKKPNDGPVDAREWCCTNRLAHPSNQPLVLNEPTNNFLLCLPPLHCKQCRRVNPKGYRWDFTDCRVRDVSLDFLIRNQGIYDTCVAHAFLAAMDFGRRVHEAFKYRAEPGHQLSDQSFFSQFKKIFKTVFGYETDPEDELGYMRAECFVYIAQNYGIGCETSGLLARFKLRSSRKFCQKMGQVFRIPDGADADRTELIVRLIAGGFALTGSIAVGRTFHFTTSDEIYDASPTAAVNHTVVLMGSGVTDHPRELTPKNRVSRLSWPDGRGPRIYLRARGSWDDDAHPRSSRDGRGGDFNIWADQVTEVLGFHLKFDD